MDTIFIREFRVDAWVGQVGLNVAAGIAVARQGTVAVSIDDLLTHPETKQMAQGN